MEGESCSPQEGQKQNGLEWATAEEPGIVLKAYDPFSPNRPHLLEAHSAVNSPVVCLLPSQPSEHSRNPIDQPSWHWRLTSTCPMLTHTQCSPLSALPFAMDDQLSLTLPCHSGSTATVSFVLGVVFSVYLDKCKMTHTCVFHIFHISKVYGDIKIIPSQGQYNKIISARLLAVIWAI